MGLPFDASTSHPVQAGAGVAGSVGELLAAVAASIASLGRQRLRCLHCCPTSALGDGLRFAA
jgi:hypothetical protein